jgi:hypothetical protein
VATCSVRPTIRIAVSGSRLVLAVPSPDCEARRRPRGTSRAKEPFVVAGG